MATGFFNCRDLYNEAVKLYHLKEYPSALERFQTCLLFLNESALKEEEYITSTQDYIQKINHLLQETPHNSVSSVKIADNSPEISSIKDLNTLADYYYKANNFELAIKTYDKLIKSILKEQTNNPTLLADTYWSQAMAYKGLHENSKEARLKKDDPILAHVKRLVELARDTYPKRKDINDCNAYLSDLASELAIAQFDEAIDYVRLSFTQSSPMESYKHALDCVEHALNIFKNEVPSPSELGAQIHGWCERLEDELKRKFHRAPMMHLGKTIKKSHSNQTGSKNSTARGAPVQKRPHN